MPRNSWEQSFDERHTYEDWCIWGWCRIHWTSVWYVTGPERERYPLTFRSGGKEVWVYCGPAGYLPKKVTSPLKGSQEVVR